MAMYKHIVSSLLVIALITASLSGCATGKGLIKEPSDGEINQEASKAYAEIKAKSKISKNKEWTEMVNRVSARIAAASGEKFNWEWVLIEDPQVNAWCMPGGKMAVYTGIMPVLKTEGALAAVMGHEVAHATERHGKERYARAMNSNLIGLAIGAAAVVTGQVLCKNSTCRTLTALGGAAAGFAISFFDRKFSRGDETEADQVGQVLMAKAGYDPAEAPRVWERMAAANGGKAPPEWMSTHPADETRKANLAKWLPAAQEHYARSPSKYGVGEAIK